MIGVLMLLVQAATTPPPPLPACAAPEHRQFDFWVGEWTVTPTGKQNVVATSVIENLYGGCAVRENWMPLKGSVGGSLSSYFSDEKVWRQVWVDSSNGWATLEGSFQNGAMVLAGYWKNINGPGTREFTRTSWSLNPDGTVRQLGEARSADGKTWTKVFDFTYHPKAKSKP